MMTKKATNFFSTIKNLDYGVAFKIGVTAGLSYYAGQALSLISGRPDLLNNLWCVLTSIVVIKPNLGGTYEAAIYRFLGILIGSILGGLFSIYLGFTGLALGLGIFFTGVTCLLINIKDSIRIASLSVAVVMVLHNLYPEHNPWVFSFFSLPRLHSRDCNRDVCLPFSISKNGRTRSLPQPRQDLGVIGKTVSTLFGRG